MANKKAAKDPQDAVLAGLPITDGDTSETPTQSATPTGIQYGTPCRTVSDMSDADVTWILPKEDYRGACYMWPVPNGEIVIPGNALYRMPTTKAVMTDCFGFMPSDNLLDFGGFAVPYCSDWQGYVAKRNAGEWEEEAAKIQGLLTSAPAEQGVPPEGTDVAGWDSIASVTLGWNLLPESEGVIPMLGTPKSDDLLTDIQAKGATFLSELAPSLPSAFIDGSTFLDPVNEIVQLKLGSITLSTPELIQQIPNISKVPLSVLLEMGRRTYCGTSLFDLQSGIFTGSATIAGYALSPSNCNMQIMFSDVTLHK